MVDPYPPPSAELTKLSRRVSVLERELRELSGALVVFSLEVTRRAQREGGQE